MPSIMIHLVLAQKLSHNAPMEFYIGNMAPDAISVRQNFHFKDKDNLHFRTSDTRLKDIENLAKQIDMNNPYCKGYISHLFLDMHWDNDCVKPFTQKHGDGWFSKYRGEISKAASWIYHNNDRLKNLYNDMVANITPALPNVQGIDYDEILKFYNKNHQWYSNNDSKQSTAFSNAFIEKYTDEIAQKYVKWKNTL